MRPVNLIPPEDRRGERAPLRAGIASYAIVGGLVVALIAVTALVLTGNTVREREASQASLEAELQSATQRAQAVRGFAEFAAIAENRVATVTDLARSRFDWERVLREMAKVVPESVWLSKITGTVSPDVQVPNSAEIGIRGSVPGPALSLVGCVVKQADVGRLVNAIEDIDGVTRVTVANSERSLSAGEATAEDCRFGPFVAEFKLVAAFDEVAIDPQSGAPVPLPEPGSGGADQVAAGAEAEGERARESVREQTDKGRRAADVVSGTIGGGR